MIKGVIAVQELCEGGAIGDPKGSLKSEEPSGPGSLCWVRKETELRFLVAKMSFHGRTDVSDGKDH